MRRTVRSTGRPEHEILGQLLRERREAAGLTQRQLAAELGRTHAFVWKIESGTQHVDLPTLFDLAKLTNAEPEEIVREVKKEACKPAEVGLGGISRFATVGFKTKSQSPKNRAILLDTSEGRANRALALQVL